MVNSAAAHDFRSDAPDNLSLQRQPEQRDTSYRLADFLIIVCILILGALASVSRDRASDFLYDDVAAERNVAIIDERLAKQLWP